MSVPLPWEMPFPITFTVTKLQANAQGGTDVECWIQGSKLRAFTLDRNVDTVGADELEPDIRAMVIEILQRSLEVSE